MAMGAVKLTVTGFQATDFVRDQGVVLGLVTFHLDGQEHILDRSGGLDNCDDVQFRVDRFAANHRLVPTVAWHHQGQPVDGQDDGCVGLGLAERIGIIGARQLGNDDITVDHDLRAGARHGYDRGELVTLLDEEANLGAGVADEGDECREKEDAAGLIHMALGLGVRFSLRYCISAAAG